MPGSDDNGQFRVHLDTLEDLIHYADEAGGGAALILHTSSRKTEPHALEIYDDYRE